MCELKSVLGKDLAFHRIGEHSNPQNRAKDTSNIKDRMFCIFGVFLTYLASVGNREWGGSRKGVFK